MAEARKWFLFSRASDLETKFDELHRIPCMIECNFTLDYEIFGNAYPVALKTWL